LSFQRRHPHACGIRGGAPFIEIFLQFLEALPFLLARFLLGVELAFQLFALAALLLQGFSKLGKFGFQRVDLLLCAVVLQVLLKGLLQEPQLKVKRGICRLEGCALLFEGRLDTFEALQGLVYLCRCGTCAHSIHPSLGHALKIHAPEAPATAIT